MIAATDEAIAKLDAVSDAPVDLREAMQRMTLEIAGRTMFSFGMDRHGAELRAFVNEYGTRLARPHFLDLLLPLCWPTPQDFARARFRKRWTKFVAMLMAERRAAGKNDSAPLRDLFDLMDAARDPETGEAFSDEQLGDQVATMILAGHETTGTALFWSLYLLALDPATQEQVAAEVAATAGRRARHRPAEIHPRRARRDHAALSAGVSDRARRRRSRQASPACAVKKGDVILIAPWLLHRHEKLWQQSERVHSRALHAAGASRPTGLPICRSASARGSASARILRWSKPPWRWPRSSAPSGSTLLDREPVMPIGVVTTQPDRSPMFGIDAALIKTSPQRFTRNCHPA